MSEPTDTSVGDAPKDGGRVELPGFRSPTDPSRALRSGLPREYVQQVQRGRLIDAFVQVAAEHGVEAAGVRSTCQRAGVAFNTFYQYFDTREDLFLAAFRTGVETMFDHAGAAFITAEGSWTTRLEAALSALMRLLADNPAFARFFAVESRKVGAVGTTEVDRVFERSFAMFAGARRALDLPLDDLEMAQMVVGAIFSPIYWTIRSNRTRDLPELAPKLIAFIAVMMRDREDPPDA